LEFNVPFQHKYGYIRDEYLQVDTNWKAYVTYDFNCLDEAEGLLKVTAVTYAEKVVTSRLACGSGLNF